MNREPTFIEKVIAAAPTTEISSMNRASDNDLALHVIRQLTEQLKEYKTRWWKEMNALSQARYLAQGLGLDITDTDVVIASLWPDDTILGD